MPDDRTQRRLAAILAADVVGYSRLMEADEEGTLHRLQGAIHEVVMPTIAEHNGRLVKTTGDGLLAEFVSVVDAVRCAVALQARQGARDASLSADRRIQYRTGINLGDIMVEGGDIFGDGVNIAARLEGLADTGGILLSGTAYDQVKKQAGLGFVFLGEQRVKNIAELVRVYRVLTEPESIGRTSYVKRPAGKWTRVLGFAAATALAVIAIAVGVTSWRPWAPAVELASIERMALPLPDKPSIVVLPFINMSGDPQQEYFADGITENLTTDLSSLAGLFVIARNTAFTYKGRAVTPAKIAKELGVRYVVEGSVQRAGDVVRINAQLIDAISGGHAWAKRFDGSLNDIFALQDQVTAEVLKALAPRLTAGEQQALRQQETTVPEAYDAFLRGWEHYQRTTPADFVAAVPHFEQAIALDPTYARAHAALAMVYFRAYDQNWTGSIGMSEDAAFRKARDYLDLAKVRPTSTSHQVAANISRGRGWYEDAVKEFQAAIALDPSDSWSYAYLAYSLIYAGKAAEAETQIETALRLDPHFPPLFLFYRGLAQFQQNRMEEAAVTLEEAVRLNPDDTWPFAYLAASYAYLEREKEGADAIAAFNAARVRQGGTPFVMIELTEVDPLYKPPPGSPLTRELLRLGIPQNFDAPEFDSLRLTAREVEALFFGHRVRGHSTWNGREWGASVALDGTAVRFGFFGTDAGVAKAEDGRLCIVLSTTSACGSILRNPGGTKVKANEYLWVDVLAFPFSQIE